MSDEIASVAADSTRNPSEESKSVVTGDVAEAEEIVEAEPSLAEDDPHRYHSGYFLQKHTDSFKCFEQYLCSASDLRLTLSFFDPLTDPGLEEALNYIGKNPKDFA